MYVSVCASREKLEAQLRSILIAYSMQMDVGNETVEYFCTFGVLRRRDTQVLRNWTLCKISFQSMALLLMLNGASRSAVELGLVTFALVFVSKNI